MAPLLHRAAINSTLLQIFLYATTCTQKNHFNGLLQVNLADGMWTFVAAFVPKKKLLE